MTDLTDRLKHFESHQLAAGDEYGAEVLHNAAREIQNLRDKADAAAKAMNAVLAVLEEVAGDGKNIRYSGCSCNEWRGVWELSTTQKLLAAHTLASFAPFRTDAGDKP